ncbi:alginate O-acetyltransferase AlgX-related protein [Sedimentibacter saalensis]|uniref:alginate O-acetyltransferase AlgX-related protein n=1 Tax=Sedimentibacter saalensis TaxID=130788 RepID=UPI0028969F27|nr:hypothetical protein [Sedimentibacter saalensis]
MINKIIKKYSSILLILIFVLIISCPLVFINKDPNKVSVVENKKLASFPKFYTDEFKLNTRFIQEFEGYINDNIGFKQQAVISDIVWNYKLYKKLSVPSYIMGLDDNVFYTSYGEGIRTFQGKNLYSEATLSDFSKGFTQMDNYFKENGAKLYVATIPDKEGVYPELYPKEIKKLNEKSRVDLLVEYIKANTDIDINNLKLPLINSKGNDMLYYKNYDPTHWNMNGAFVGYTEIMNQMKSDYPSLKVITKDDFNIYVEKSKGTLAHLSSFESINDAMSFDDDIYTYVLNDSYKSELFIELPEGIEINANDKYFHYTNSSTDNDHTILIIGDSYIYSFLLPIISESFREVYFINFTSAQQIKNIQNKINADIVLYEFVERMFDYQIYDKLMDFQDKQVEDVNFTTLPFIENAPVFNIDYPIVDNNTLKFVKSEIVSKISGWAIDVIAEDVAKNIYIKVGENYYLPKYVAREDIALAKREYLFSGFTFEIPTEELIQSGHVEFVIISKDGTHQYRPITYSVEAVN